MQRSIFRQQTSVVPMRIQQQQEERSLCSRMATARTGAILRQRSRTATAVVDEELKTSLSMVISLSLLRKVNVYFEDPSQRWSSNNNQSIRCYCIHPPTVSKVDTGRPAWKWWKCDAVIGNYDGNSAALKGYLVHNGLPMCRQTRFLSSYSNNGSSRGKSKRQQNYEASGHRIAVMDPFVTLGIIRSSTLKYTSVKTSFLKLAMKYHPDTNTQSTSDIKRERDKDRFVAIRKAFELIMADLDGIAMLKTEAEDYVEEEDDFEEWFKNETGYDMPFMDAATMKEVAEMTETIGGGLDRDGGMWTLARMVADTVKNGGDGKSILQLDAGTVRDRRIDGTLRRKRTR